MSSSDMHMHVDDEVIALVALGEDVASDADLAHLASCPRCAQEVSALRGVVDLAREERDAPALVAPAPQVWDRVAAELGLAPTGTGPAAAPATADPPATTGAADPAPPALAPVVPLRRRRTWAWVAGAAAAGLVVGGTGAWWAARPTDPAQEVVARATLDALPGWDASGTAVVETSADGSRVLVVDLDDATPDEDGYREVWLLRPDLSGLVSLGPLSGASARVPLPADLDLDDFSVVDVSLEPLDGDPAHSGDSIVRGPLGA
ncbi:anti-sigma-K factor rskA [Cellulomonas sp. SLBN-39]|nr:anti-sigma-K factor rskA [Cellulomonas sp. SLBN-39]